VTGRIASAISGRASVARAILRIPGALHGWMRQGQPETTPMRLTISLTLALLIWRASPAPAMFAAVAELVETLPDVLARAERGLIADR
jgi:hypothetical protein